MRSRWPILAIFVLSGAAGLIYEIVWSRQLVLVFGNTTQAVSAILTGFFGGMAIGSFVGGRIADRVRSPLRLYGAIELVLVAVVLATPITFHLLHEVYRGAYGSLEGHAELLALVRSARPELAVIDIRMPPGQATEGLQAARVIRAELPGTAIIVLSAHVEVEEAMELLAGGERTGYLLKSRVTDVAEFIETVERIAAGASVVDSSLVSELIRARRRRDPLDALSPREREVLALMAQGASNAGIARQIFVTEGTVEKHVRSILTKLDLPESDTEHRRVLAVLRFLEAR